MKKVFLAGLCGLSLMAACSFMHFDGQTKIASGLYVNVRT